MTNELGTEGLVDRDIAAADCEALGLLGGRMSEDITVALKANPWRRCALTLRFHQRQQGSDIRCYFTANVYLRSRPLETISFTHAFPDEIRLECSQSSEVWSLWLSSTCFQLSAQEAEKVSTAFLPHGLRVNALQRIGAPQCTP